MLQKSKLSAIIISIIFWFVTCVVYLTIQILYGIGIGKIETVTTENIVGLVVVGTVLILLLGVIVGFFVIYPLDTTHFGFGGITRWIIAGGIQGFLLYGVVALFEYTRLEKFRDLFLMLGGFGAFKASYWLAFKLFPAREKISE